MAETIDAWKQDRKGWYIEMQPLARKDYSLDWTDFIVAGVISTAVWAVGSGVSNAGESLAGAISQIWLLAGATPLTVQASCTITLTGSPALVEVFAFRVIVRA